MTIVQVASTQRAPSKGGSRGKALRPRLIETFFELRPIFHKRFRMELDRELRDELQNVTIHQLNALMALKNHDMTMREVAKELGTGESAATAVTDRLVRQGLAERHNDPADRRLVRLELSPDGRRLVESVHEAACEKSAEMLAVLSDAQLANLVDILETLSEADEPARAAAVESSAPGHGSRATPS